jgi:protein tyrosine/serine phosphatase
MIWIGIIVLVVVLVGAGVLVWRQWFETYHFAVVQEGVLYRDGNRGVREFATMVRKARPRTIVCLVDDEEIADAGKPEFKEEMAFAKERGIEVERVVVKLGGWPTTEDVRRFLEIATDQNKQPVIVHCAQGVRRTGMMAAAFQESVMGWDRQKTTDAILRFGHSDRSIGDVKRFIEVYDPVKREVTVRLEQSQE